MRNLEKKRQYDNKYYQEHKETILNRIREKVECNLCKKMVGKHYLEKHQSCSGCTVNKTVKVDHTISNLKKQIKDIQTKLHQIDKHEQVEQVQVDSN